MSIKVTSSSSRTLGAAAEGHSQAWTWGVWTGPIKNPKPPPPAVLPPDSLWHRVYLLAYYTPAGECRLTTWRDGPDTIYIDVVVKGAGDWMPYGSNPVPQGCEIEAMPPELDRVEGKHAERLAYAASRGGVYAFGWKLGRDLKREPPRSIWWTDEEYARHLRGEPALSWPEGEGQFFGVDTDDDKEPR